MQKKLIIFDMDDTLVLTKSPIDPDMVSLLGDLLERYKVAVISGGSFPILKKNLLTNLRLPAEKLQKLSLFPTCGASYYKFENQWKNVYQVTLSEEERKKIFDAFKQAFTDIDFQQPEKLWGEQLEDRQSQITFSYYGQDSPRELKTKWDPDGKKRLILKQTLDQYIPEFDVKVGGSTSIDITKKGINKAYGIRKMIEYLKFSKEEMLFVGDKIYPGGNDYPVKEEGVECIAVDNPNDTKEVIKKLIKE